MTGLKHFPDKPYERHPEDLDSWDDGSYICQQKCDGWRVEILIGDEISYVSRHNKVLTADIEPQIKQQVDLLVSGEPNRTQLDGEWLSRREATNKKSEPVLVLFDVVRYNGKWLLKTPYEERWALLKRIFEQTEADPGSITHVRLAETVESGFASFYEAQKLIPHSEGVVIKHRKSKLLGDRKESKKNPRWFKVKYRGASDGQMTMDHLRTKAERW